MDDSSDSNTGGGVTEEAGGGVMEEETMVFVALPERHMRGKATLAWALRHLADTAPAAAVGEVVVVVAHVHEPAAMIPVMGSKFLADKLTPETVRAYRQYEREMVNKHLDEYTHQCSKMKVKCKKVVVENKDVANGISELVSLHNVRQLVMGAAADKHYSRKMEVPRSKTALAVMHSAETSCNIWFVCKEHLICTRELGVIRSLASTLSDRGAGRNSRYSRFVGHGCIRRSVSERLRMVGRTSLQQLPCLSTLGRRAGKLSLEEISVQSWGSAARDGSLPSSRGRDGAPGELGSAGTPTTLEEDCHLPDTAARHEQAVDKNSDADVSAELKEGSGDVLPDAAGELFVEKEDAAAAISANAAACSGEFSLLELQQATDSFSDAMKIGDGAHGCVYRGVLRGAAVAIKMLASHGSQEQSHFQQEVSVLSALRHPNLVTLMGCCPQASALVYEFLPNGSLEDRLAGESIAPPLTWQARTRIIAEVCSALVFLHSGTPRPAVHGDLRPANILLDASLVSKLADLGVSCLLAGGGSASVLPPPSSSSSTTFTAMSASAYMDPEFLTTGELTPLSDVYSFGIVLLRLVTGLPPRGIAARVQGALEKGEMELLVDRSAGEWPPAAAEKLMLLGLECAELSRRRRPDLMSSVRSLVEPLAKAAKDQASGHGSCENPMPSYFICPISQEVMRKPHVSADGFSYEAEAIRGWLHSGRRTSPMTKLPLDHRHVTPNYALGSAIQDFQIKHQHHHSRPILLDAASSSSSNR